jgi:hypothetical protein
MRHLVFITTVISWLGFSAIAPAGAQWVFTNGPYIGGYNINIDCFGVSDSNLFAGGESMTEFNGTALTTDNGTTWQEADQGMQWLPSYAITSIGTTLFAGTPTGVFRSTNNGTNWTASSNGLNNEVQAFAVSGTNIFAGSFNQGVFLSTDSGTNWVPVDSGFNPVYVVNTLAVIGTNIFAGTDGNGILLSTNNGTSWMSVDTGLTDFHVQGIVAIGSNLFAGTATGVFLSTDNGTSWTSSGMTGYPVSVLVVDGMNLFAAADGVSLSKDNGKSWIAVDSGLMGWDVSALALCGDYLFAGNTLGVWRRPLSEMISSNSVNLATSTNQSISAFPNPFSQSSTITFSCAVSGAVEVAIVNPLGEEVARIFSGELGEGEHSFTWDASNYPSGVYLCRLEAAGASATRLVVVEH